MPSNEEEIRELSQAVRDAYEARARSLKRRNAAIQRQRMEEKTPGAVIARWSGLTEQQVRRICREE